MEVLAGVTCAQNLIFWGIASTPLSKSEPLKDEKLNRLFKEMKDRMGMDPSIQFLQNAQVSSMAATGRLLLGGKGVVVVNSPDYFKGYSDDEILALMAHELSHLKHHDSTRSVVCGFIAQLVTGIALMTLFHMPLLPAYVISFVVFVIAFRHILIIIEYQAEKGAAKILNDRELQGYIDFQKNDLVCGLIIRNADDATWFKKFKFDSRGNMRTDWSHPKRTRVIAMMERELQNRYKLKVESA